MKNEPIINIKPLGFQWETADPFLFCVHHEDFYPAGNDVMGPNTSLLGRNIGQDFEIKDGWRMYHGQKVPGFPKHPHRGFETVTIVRKGFVDHTDSLGGSGRYGKGDVQWLTAGKGIQHAEMFPLINKHTDNTLELFQIWLNLPKVKKFAKPSYKMLWRESIPIQSVKDNNGKAVEINVIAGKLGDKIAPAPNPDSWANDPENSVVILTINMEEGASWTLPAVKEGINRTLYFHKGSSLKVGREDIPSYHAVELNSEKEVIIENGPDKSSLLLLQGKPINEPVVQHGPFVMNTREEINQAFTDYNQTQFGGWPVSDNEPVHPIGKGRFATHTNGTEEIK